MSQVCFKYKSTCNANFPNNYFTKTSISIYFYATEVDLSTVCALRYVSTHRKRITSY